MRMHERMDLGSGGAGIIACETCGSDRDAPAAASHSRRDGMNNRVTSGVLGDQHRLSPDSLSNASKSHDQSAAGGAGLVALAADAADYQRAALGLEFAFAGRFLQHGIQVRVLKLDHGAAFIAHEVI